MKKEVFKRGLAILLRAFPNKEISPEIAWPMLKDLLDEEFERAIIDIISTKVEIYPNTNMIALIRERAKKHSNRLTSGEAWGLVLKEVARVGHGGEPKFKDDIIGRAVDCVGWRDICMSENIGIERAHFFKVYENLAARESENNVRIPHIQVKMITVEEAVKHK